MNTAHPERLASPYLPVYPALGVAVGVWGGERLHTAGVFACAGASLQPHPAWWLAPRPVLLAAAVWGRQRRRVLIPMLLIACVCLGGWRYAGRPFAPCLAPGDLALYHSDTPYGRAAGRCGDRLPRTPRGLRGATYPPGVQQLLAATAAAALPTDAAVAISTDGRTFSLSTLPYAVDAVVR